MAAGSPPPPPPAARKATNVLTRKLGPAPVYVWIIAAAGLYLGYRYLAGGSTTASSGSSPASTGDTSGIPQTTSGGGGSADTGASGGGGATAADSLSADLLSTLIGNNGALAGQLADALTGASSVIAGLGSEALSNNGLLEQAIIASYTPAAGGAPSFATTSAAPAATQQAAPVGQPVAQGRATSTAVYTAPPSSGAQPKIALATIASDHPTTTTGAVTRYYTYKKDVPLKAGQTLHFTSGRGYYAA